MRDLAGSYTLRDEGRVEVRPIRPEDKERLQAGLRLLSPRSRYLRFLSDPNELSPKELRYLTEVDQVDHLAWIALDPDRPEDPGLGVARCVRLADEPDVAEVAVTVVDAHQGRGLGTLLLGILGMAAAEQGIRAFRGFVLASNSDMLEILEQVGAQVGEREGAATWFDVPVPTNLDELPDSPAGRAFRALAEQIDR
ncbi:MAG TPA: N-acetyltransferase [Planctomycetes bacterium]|nr:N-acetyltransferase [Planctomycetota bacterium]